MSQSRCPEHERLVAFALGQMDLGAIEEVARHLETCSVCEQAVNTVAVDDTLLASLRQPKTPPPTDPALENVLQRVKSLSIAQDTQADLETVADQLTCLRPAESADELGRLSHYRVRQVIGIGGMGAVFLAEDSRSKTLVALKVMRPSLAASSKGRKRFLREIKSLSAIQHPCVVSVLEIGEDIGVPYFVMPLLRGETLETCLARGGRLPMTEVLSIARDIASGLAAAHEQNLIHRDIKPANVFLCDMERGGPDQRAASGTETTAEITAESSPADRVRCDRRAILMDFGLARDETESSVHTQAGSLLGTPQYMAPESIEGGTIDQRSDLFSLGTVLYRLCTGTVPFVGANSMSVLVAVSRDTPTPVTQLNSDVPPRLAELIRRLLEKDRNLRPQSARDVCDELDAITRGPQSWENTISSPLAANAITMQASGATLARRSSGEVTGGLTPPRSLGRFLPQRTALSLLGLAAAIALAVLLVIQTRHGRIEVELAEGAASEVQIEVLQAGTVHLLNALSGWSIKIGPGEWNVRISGDMDHFQLSQDSIRVTRGQTSVLRVTRKPTDSTARANAVRDDVARQHQSGLGNAPLAWQPSPEENVLHGLIPRPTSVPGIKSWQLETTLPRGGLSDLQWSPDGRWLALANDRQLRIYEFIDGELQLRRLLSDGTLLHRLTWSPTSDRVVVTDHENRGRLRVWNVLTGQQEQSAKLPEWLTSQPAWSPNGEWLVAAGSPGSSVGKVILYHMPDLTFDRELANLEGTGLSCVCWSPDSSTIATGSHQDAVVRLWNLDGTSTAFPAAEPGRIDSIQWSPDGQWIAAGVIESRPPWRVFTQLLSPSGDKGPKLPGGHGLVESLSWSRDSRRLAVASNNVWLWDEIRRPEAEPRRICETFANQQFRCSWHPAGRFIVFGHHNDARLWIHDAKQDSTCVALEAQPRVAGTATARSHDQLAFSTTDGRVRVQQRDGAFQVVHQHQPVSGWVKDAPFENAWGFGSRLEWSATGKHLASQLSLADPLLRVWNADDPSALSRKIAVGIPPGPRLQARGDERMVLLMNGLSEVDLATGEVTQNWPAPKQQDFPFAVTNDGERLAYTDGSKIKILHLSNGEVLRELDNPGAYMVSWTADGHFLLLGKDYGHELWDARTWQKLWSAGFPQCYGVISPDGQRIATRNGLADAETGTLRDRFRHECYPYSWFADSQRLAAATDSHAAILSAANGRVEHTIVPITPDHTLVFDAAGNLEQGDLSLLDRECVCIIERDDGTREIMQPTEFLKQSGLTAWPSTSNSSKPRRDSSD